MLPAVIPGAWRRSSQETSQGPAVGAKSTSRLGKGHPETLKETQRTRRALKLSATHTPFILLQLLPALNVLPFGTFSPPHPGLMQGEHPCLALLPFVPFLPASSPFPSQLSHLLYFCPLVTSPTLIASITTCKISQSPFPTRKGTSTQMPTEALQNLELEHRDFLVQVQQSHWYKVDIHTLIAVPSNTKQ